MLSHEGKVYDERIVLDKAYNKVKTAHETAKRSYYRTVLKEELTCFPVFMQKWFELAKVDPKTSVGLKHEKEYEQFRAIYYALFNDYEDKYRWRNLRTLLQLIANQDNIVFQEELKNKNFSYLFAECGILNYELVNRVLSRANMLESDVITKYKVKLLIDVCNKLEKEDLERNKFQIKLRDNILNPFDDLELE